MKFSRNVICASLMLVALVSFGYSQNSNSAIEVRTNVLVLNSDGKYADDVKQEDLKIFEDGIEQKITYFAKKEPVTNVGFIIDNTGSMRQQIDDVKSIGKKVVDAIGEQDEAFIVRFVDIKKTSIFEDWTSDKTLLNKSINNMFIEGGKSALIDAINLGWLKISMREEKNKTKKYALVLISDCEDRDSASDISQILFKMRNTDVQIYVVALTGELPTEKNFSGLVKSGSIIFIDSTKDKENKKKKPKEIKIKDGSLREIAESFAKNLAFQTGGRAFLFDKNNQLSVDDVVKNLKDEFRSQYVVRYVSTNQDRKNTERKLTVQIADDANGNKRSGMMREEYIVPKSKK